MALITMKKAVIAYEGEIAVENASFRVEQGDYLVILGENGSGKTSVMRAMLGLVRLREGIVSYGDGLKRERIGYLPQQTVIRQDFPASVEEVVLSGTVTRMRNPFFPGRAEKQRAREQMERMDLWEMRKRPYRALSGGQKQRVLLARALCASDRILLLDEPVTGLDPRTAGEMYDLIASLNREGMAIVTVSHDMHTSLRDAKHVLVMDRTVEFFGDRETWKEWRQRHETA